MSIDWIPVLYSWATYFILSAGTQSEGYAGGCSLGVGFLFILLRLKQRKVKP